MQKSGIIFLGIAFLLFFSLASAKDYSLDRAEIKMMIGEDGLVSVEENITFNFSGQFSFAYRDIPYGQWNVKNVSVWENETPLQFENIDQGDSQRINWHYSAFNETKTFTIKYEIENAVTAYNDIAELNWKVWGEGWEKPLKEIEGFIELPMEVKDSNEVYSWGHPELNGKIGLLEDKRVIFQAFGIPKGQWVEIRLVFPRKYLPETTYALVSRGNGLEKIIAEENAWKAQEDSRNAILGMLPFLFLIFIAGQIIVFAIVWHKYGREPKTGNKDIYQREVPYDYSPAIVSSLLNQFTKAPGFDQITGEILHLCLLGKLKLEKTGKKDFNINLLDRKKEGLPLSEKMVLELLEKAALYGIEKKLLIFKTLKMDKTPNIVSLEELKYYVLYHRIETRQWAEEWRRCVKHEAEKMGFFAKNTAIKYYLLGTAILSILAIIVFVPLIFGVFATGFILPVMFRDSLPNRTLKGAEHFAKWKKLKKFLNDFSNLKEMPPDAIILWEKYLVYSIPLGVAKKVQKAMDLVFKDYQGTMHSHIFAGGAISGADFGAFGSSIGSFSSSFASATATSGGGGFGGGGGGGGGGAG